MRYDSSQCAAPWEAVELLDIYPTLTELCGLLKPDGLAGQSLARQLDHPEPTKNFALSQFPRPVDYNFKSAPPKSMGYSIRDDRYRLTQWIDFASGKVLAEEFYDYTVPRPESKNLIDHPRCEATLEAGSLCQGAAIEIT